MERMYTLSLSLNSEKVSPIYLYHEKHIWQQEIDQITLMKGTLVLQHTANTKWYYELPPAIPYCPFIKSILQSDFLTSITSANVCKLDQST